MMAENNKSQGLQDAPTLAQDVNIVNELDTASVWLWVLAKTASPGTRIVSREEVLRRLALSEEQSASIDRIWDYCGANIFQKKLSPASMLADITDCGLDRERGLLIVDVAMTTADVFQDTLQQQQAMSISGLAQKVGELESLITRSLAEPTKDNIG